MTDPEDFDEDLEGVQRTLWVGEREAARQQLARFAARFATRANREERVLRTMRGAPNELLAKVRREHDRLCGLVAVVVSALVRKNDRSGLEALDLLRSLVVIHLAKEASLAELAE